MGRDGGDHPPPIKGSPPPTPIFLLLNQSVLSKYGCWQKTGDKNFERIGIYQCVFSCGGGFQPPSPRSIALGKRVKEWVKRVNFFGKIFCQNIFNPPLRKKINFQRYVIAIVFQLYRNNEYLMI